MIYRLYDRFILKYPGTVLLTLFIILAWLGYEARKLEIDASAETLLLEDDKDLRYSRLINERYGNPDFLFIAYRPKGEDLFSASALGTIGKLRDELKSIEGIESVVTLLDVPLLESPVLPVKEMVKKVRTLEDADTDKTLAKKELLSSPLYKDLMVSADAETTAIQVNLREDDVYRTLLKQRNDFREKVKKKELTHAEQQELEKINLDFKIYRDGMRARQHKLIKDVRQAMDHYRDRADLFLGGVAMVSDDLISFVRNDLRIFGVSVTFMLMATLWVIFRQIRWLLIPLLCCLLAVAATCGILGITGWEATVISSNFVSVEIIITLSGTIHLIVRYRELLLQSPGTPQHLLALDTVTSIDTPSLYCVLTTMAGFGSLIFCNILPVIHFGWMMTLGIGLSLILTFLIFPTVLMLMKPLPPNLAFESHFQFTRKMARLTAAAGNWIIAGAIIVLLLSAAGMKRLIVENSFIDYFRETTEIYRGMSLIDRELGGTTPLDVVIDFPAETAPIAADAKKSGDSEGELDQFEAEFEAEGKEARYWFTSRRMEEAERIHDYLDAIPETGKVMSIGTLLKAGRTIKGGKPLEDFDLALIYSELPERFRKIILSPYVSVESSQTRFSIRIRDSEKGLRRDELLKRIQRELTEKVGIEPERVHLTGLMVLYNNMLQSLFSSQIETLGIVLAAIMTMFMILFRSLRIALIAICPSLVSVFSVLGFMGWVGIPLDMMTITIASISVGIAVDDTIHYIYRFRREYAEQEASYLDLMHYCHSNIGFAMYYTSVVIIIGFSVLVISSFIPTIYFGLLTGVAMLFAMIANQTLLAALIVFIKPFGPEKSARPV